MGWMSAIGSLVSTAGSIADKYAMSAYNAHLQRDLMSRQNTYNLENWYNQLTQGPTLQRQGLQAAGYNPLLALSGGVSSPSIGGSSALAASQGNSSGWDNFGRTMKDVEESSLVDDERKVKQAQVENLQADNELKEALRDKAKADAVKSDADTTKTKVETFTEPARVVSAALGAGATAYGAKKALEAFKSSKKDSIPALKLRKVNGKNFGVSLGSKALQSIGVVGLPLLSGAVSAKATKSMMNKARREGHWTDERGIERNPKWIYGGVPIVP